MGVLEGVKWLISQADYNGPKKQWNSTDMSAASMRFSNCGGSQQWRTSGGWSRLEMDKILFNQPRDRTTPLLRKFTEDERKRRRSFERKDNSVPLAGSVKYIAPGTSWSVQFHFREKGKEVNFSCFGREFMENLCLLMNIPLINLY